MDKKNITSLPVYNDMSHWQAYWYEGCDVSDHEVLERVARRFGLSSLTLLSSELASRNLRANTAEAAERGAFGVPR